MPKSRFQVHFKHHACLQKWSKICLSQGRHTTHKLDIISRAKPYFVPIKHMKWSNSIDLLAYLLHLNISNLPSLYLAETVPWNKTKLCYSFKKVQHWTKIYSWEKTQGKRLLQIFSAWTILGQKKQAIHIGITLIMLRLPGSLGQKSSRTNSALHPFMVNEVHAIYHLKTFEMRSYKKRSCLLCKAVIPWSYLSKHKCPPSLLCSILCALAGCGHPSGGRPDFRVSLT